MVTLKQFVGKLLMNCLSVFDHFVGLTLKGLSLNFLKIRLISDEIRIFESPISKILVQKQQVDDMLHKINATNDTKRIKEIMLQMIRGVHKYYLCRNSSHLLMLPLHSTFITQISVSLRRKLLNMT